MRTSSRTPDTPGHGDDPATALGHELRRTGYYPDLVAQVLDLAIAGEQVVAHLLQPETTFHDVEVRRHLTALVLTSTRLVVAHVDDHVQEADIPMDGAPAPQREIPGLATALASTEAVPLREIRSVVITQGFSDPDRPRGARRRDLTISLGWGAVQRIDLEPTRCADPNCEADHGLTGASTPDDLVIRVSAEAEGDQALEDALTFARALSAATSRL